MIELKFYQDIPSIRDLKGIAAKLEKIVDTSNHKINVRFLHAPYIHISHKGEMVQANFYSLFGDPWINLALDFQSYAKYEGTSEPAAFDNLVESFIHELCHYEQFRDGKPLTERGVKVRSENILKQLLGE